MAMVALKGYVVPSCILLTLSDRNILESHKPMWNKVAGGKGLDQTGQARFTLRTELS